MIVVDTNIISYFYLNGEYTEFADKGFKKDPHWAAPLIWRSEFRNVLALYLREKIITFDDAIKIIREAESLMEDNEYPVDSANVLNLIGKSDCSAYDCEFAALAMELSVPLVTMDKKILSNFPDISIRLDHFVEKG